MLLVRWLCSYWCNYRCSYCLQDHRRTAGHWADAATVPGWLHAFQRHFAGKDMQLAITGGEPMLDKRHMEPLLFGLSEVCTRVRVDTNGSWNPAGWGGDRSKLVLMLSWHPEHVTMQQFFQQLNALLLHGWHIGMCTLVMLPERFSLLPLLRSELAARSVPLNCNILDGQLYGYTAEQVEQLKACIPAADWHYRSHGCSPRGRMCRFPSLAYEMQPDGSLVTGCHAKRAGSIFAEQLPELFAASVPCPHSSCSCLDKYSYLDELTIDNSPTPLESFARRLPLQLVR